MDYKLFDSPHVHSKSLRLEIKDDSEPTNRITPKTTTYTTLKIQPTEEKPFSISPDSIRDEWYSSISESCFKPNFTETKLVFFLDLTKEKSTCISESFHRRLEHAIQNRLQTIEDIEKAEQEERILSSLTEFCRYVPDLDQPNANIFVDESTGGIGVTIKKSGTLSLLVHTAGSVDFSYASKAQFGGLVRITGTAKFTKNIKNSEHIKSLLGLLEGK